MGGFPFDWLMRFACTVRAAPRCGCLCGGWELCTDRIFGFVDLNIFMLGFVYCVRVGCLFGVFCLCLRFCLG